MSRKSRRMPKLVAIVGGFLIMAGMVLLGLAALAVIGFLNVGMLLENKYLLTFATVAVVVGILDAFSAVIIARW